MAIDNDAIIALINEFYATQDEVRRHELDQILCRFKEEFPCDETISTCIFMVTSATASPHVRYFGTMLLYDVIRKRSGECIENLAMFESLKAFVIENLTNGAHAQTQSITNKLSSTLAILVLYSVPDVWSEPVAELTNLWATQPELLLRVLSEIAAEFGNVTMPLAQRSKLKTELHRISEDIIKIIWTVLASGDASPSTRQAAVDCVEQWVSLPGVTLQQWAAVLSVVFGVVSDDCAALSNLLNILSDNCELVNMPQLVMDMVQFITHNVSQKVCQELKEDGCSEEAISLVSATCCLAEKAVSLLVDNAVQADSTQLSELVIMMVGLSTWPGEYPIQEKVSDHPANFFCQLREELSTSSVIGKKPELFRAMGLVYGQVLNSAIMKMAFTVRYDSDYSAEDKELFRSYRKSRSSVALDAYLLSGGDILGLLNVQLHQAISSGDVYRQEAILFLWECTADYCNESDGVHIARFIELMPSLAVQEHEKPLNEPLTRRGDTLMRLLYCLSHLVQEHEQATQLEMALIPTILSHVAVMKDAQEPLYTLKKYVDEKPSSLQMLGDAISQTCYTYFMNDDNAKKTRLLALRSIGKVLATKKSSEAMATLAQIVSTHAQGLESVDQLGDDQQLTKQFSFKISIFSALFASLAFRPKSTESVNEEDLTIVKIVREAMPVLEQIHERISTGGPLVDDLGDALHSAMMSVPDAYAEHVFPFVFKFLDTALLTNPVAGCRLAKSTVLICGGTLNERIFSAIEKWFSLAETNVAGPQLEELLGLIYQIIKKEWKAIRAYPERSIGLLRSAINVSAYVILNCQDPNVVRTASQLLASIATSTTIHDDVAARQLIASYGGDLVKTVFQKLQRETIRQTVDSLAEVLFFFCQQFPTETRMVLNSEENGNSPMVAAMFREIGNLRNFKKMTLRFNLASVNV